MDETKPVCAVCRSLQGTVNHGVAVNRSLPAPNNVASYAKQNKHFKNFVGGGVVNHCQDCNLQLAIWDPDFTTHP